MNEHKRYSVM